MMKAHRRLDSGIEQYIFSLEEHGLSFDINITTLIDGGEALLIDAGYPEHGSVVKKMLDERGIQVKRLVLSHYHPDHAAGMVAFPDANIYCSEDYEINFKNCSELWDAETAYRKADYLLHTGDQMTFGAFELTFHKTPGHSVCSLSVIINGAYVHPGDLIMNDQHDQPALPLICKDGDIGEHLKSLEWLLSQSDKIFLLPHGNTLVSQEAIVHAITIRALYLKSLIEAYELWHDKNYEALKLEAWSCPQWHKANMKMAQVRVL
ncbi:MAG: MBL fold metallo-hydrolase [Clostridia bacterium]|nr:MBL fold metallo-hydrolase [Clostridia bacterium]